MSADVRERLGAGVPFRLYVVAEGEGVRDEVTLLSAKARDRVAIYWRQPTADDLPGLVDELRAFRTPLFVKETDLAAWPRLRAEGGAAGVHLKGADIAPASVARARFARPVWISRAIHSTDDARRAREDGADLAVFGHVFETASKPGAAPRGLAALRDACEAAAPVPVFALGGITPARIAEVRAAGAWGVATRGGLLPGRAARATLDAWLDALS